MLEASIGPLLLLQINFIQFGTRTPWDQSGICPPPRRNKRGKFVQSSITWLCIASLCWNVMVHYESRGRRIVKLHFRYNPKWRTAPKLAMFNSSFAYGGLFCPGGQFLAYFSVTNNVRVKSFRHILGKTVLYRMAQSYFMLSVVSNF